MSSFSSDQTTLNFATIGAATLSRAGRARITSIQGYGVAASTLTLYDSADAVAACTAVADYKFGKEGLAVYVSDSGILIQNGIVYNLAGAGGSVTLAVTGA